MAEETSIVHSLGCVVEADEHANQDNDDGGGQPFFSWPHLRIKKLLPQKDAVHTYE